MTARFCFALLLALSIFSCTEKQQTPPVEQGTDPALAMLRAALEKDPQNDSLLYRRAEVYYNLDAFDEALRDLTRAIQLDSMRPAYYHLLADVLIDYARPNDSRRALEVLSKAAEKFPDNLHTLLKLSEFQLIVRQYPSALGTLDKVLQRDPQNAEAFFMTGRVALDMGDTTRAVAALKRSVQFDAANADAWIFLGRIFLPSNNPQALQYFENALRVDSTRLEAREYKGVYFKQRGEFDKAFEVYRDIVRRNPDYSNAFFDMGIIYLDLDSLDQAIRHFDLTLKTDPIFVRAFYYRGVAYEAKGDLESAKRDYTQASRMAPNFTEAVEAAQRLGEKGK